MITLDVGHSVTRDEDTKLSASIPPFRELLLSQLVSHPP